MLLLYCFSPKSTLLICYFYHFHLKLKVPRCDEFGTSQKFFKRPTSAPSTYSSTHLSSSLQNSNRILACYQKPQNLANHRKMESSLWISCCTMIYGSRLTLLAVRDWSTRGKGSKLVKASNSRSSIFPSKRLKNILVIFLRYFFADSMMLNAYYSHNFILGIT